MKIKFVSVEDGIYAIGFRKVAAVARSIKPETEIYYISPRGSVLSFFNLLFKPGKHDYELSTGDVERICTELADADMVCFSSMTSFAELTKRVIKGILQINPKVYIVWGGIHPIVYPEDAIQSANAICIGEGETAFKQFLEAYERSDDYTTTNNFWFKESDEIIKNAFLHLHTPEELGNFPFPIYMDNEKIFETRKGFVPLTVKRHISNYGVSYWTVWTIGCPYKCTFCSNSKFIENDKHYRKIRYSSVDYIIAEVKEALRKGPYISSVYFADDSFMALPIEVMERFAKKWREEINIPFMIPGVTPGLVKKEKFKILIWGGMQRVRMGIQSGSNRLLKFYKRPNRPGLLLQETSIIADFSDYMIPPSYDIILDNPIETRQDVLDTLELLYSIRRPYVLNLYALKVLPNTDLAFQFQQLGIEHKDITDGYMVPTATLANVAVYMLAVFTPPRVIFDFFVKRAKPYTEDQSLYPWLMFIFRVLHLIKQGVSNLWHMNFVFLPGRVGWLLWKLNIIKLWQNNVLKNPTEVMNPNSVVS